MAIFVLTIWNKPLGPRALYWWEEEAMTLSTDKIVVLTYVFIIS
jgi:hypothetical protein